MNIIENLNNIKVNIFDEEIKFIEPEICIKYKSKLYRLAKIDDECCYKHIPIKYKGYFIFSGFFSTNLQKKLKFFCAHTNSSLFTTQTNNYGIWIDIVFKEINQLIIDNLHQYNLGLLIKFLHIKIVDKLSILSKKYICEVNYGNYLIRNEKIYVGFECNTPKNDDIMEYLKYSIYPNSFVISTYNENEEFINKLKEISGSYTHFEENYVYIANHTSSDYNFLIKFIEEIMNYFNELEYSVVIMMDITL